MRRSLAPLLALALCAFLAPPVGAEDKGVLVVVSNGPGEGTLTLPKAVRVGYAWDVTRTGKSPYVLLAVSRGAGASYALVNFPEVEDHSMYAGPWDSRGESIPAGRSTVRMLAVGPTTVRIPVTGFRGTRTVRLDRPLRQGRAEIRHVPLRDVHLVEDVIPFTLPKHSVLVHGVVRRHLAAVRRDRTCTTIRGDRCGSGVGYPPGAEWDVLRDEWAVLHVDLPWREGDAVTAFEQVSVDPEPMTHFLLVLPTA